MVPRPHIAIRDPQECVAAANSNPLPRGSVAVPSAFMAKKISHKQVLFSFALIYLLTDNIPCFLNTLLRSTRSPLLPAGPHYFILGKSLASGASCVRDKWEEVTQRPFPGQIPGILLYCHLQGEGQNHSLLPLSSPRQQLIRLCSYLHTTLPPRKTNRKWNIYNPELTRKPWGPRPQTGFIPIGCCPLPQSQALPTFTDI